MFTIHRPSQANRTDLEANQFHLNLVSHRSRALTRAIILGRQSFFSLMIGSVALAGLTGCGQKGELYLAETSNPTVNNNADVLGSAADSNAYPQDTAFAGIYDNNYQNNRYLEQKQVLPDITDDPNDY